VPNPVEAAEQAASVRAARPADAPRMARALARAFEHDPAAAWFFPDERRRLRRLERAFEIAVTRVFLPRGTCFTTDGGVGAALWSPPGAWRLSVWAQLRLLPATARAYGRDLPRSMRGFAFLEHHHPAGPPHWYLPFLGVDPDWQGRGIGTALLRPVLDRCDARGLPAYLEASTPRNRACYERSGFGVTEEVRMPGGPGWWLMWRDPAPDTSAQAPGATG
jgi:ribosomal protein S18 acetylase RimI-like enzyme